MEGFREANGQVAVPFALAAHWGAVVQSGGEASLMHTEHSYLQEQRTKRSLFSESQAAILAVYPCKRAAAHAHSAQCCCDQPQCAQAGSLCPGPGAGRRGEGCGARHRIHSADAQRGAAAVQRGVGRAQFDRPGTNAVAPASVAVMGTQFGPAVMGASWHRDMAVHSRPHAQAPTLCRAP